MKNLLPLWLAASGPVHVVTHKSLQKFCYMPFTLEECITTPTRKWDEFWLCGDVAVADAQKFLQAGSIP